MKVAADAVPWSKFTEPGTTVEPRSSCTEDGVSVLPATGSLNTITIAALSG
jgi:hypothetical protein